MVKVKPCVKVITIETALWFSFVQTIRRTFVQQIEPAKDAVRMEEVVTLFSMAFGQISALKVVDRFVLSSLTHELTTAMLTLGSFFNSSKANWASTRSGLTIRASAG
jgi:hypothetical protein